MPNESSENARLLPTRGPPDDDAKPIERLETGIPGLDQIALGGLPRARTTIVAGSSGTGKTMLGIQFLVEGIRRYQQPGIFVTFEEKPNRIYTNLASFQWGLRRAERDRQLTLIDLTAKINREVFQVGNFDLSGIVARIAHAIEQTGAQRVTLDSVGTLFHRFSDHGLVRDELHRLIDALVELQATTIMTIERTHEYGPVSRFDIEEFVADGVILLRNPLEYEKRRRTIEILKMRGAPHQKGEYPYTIDPRDGITIIPLSAIELTQQSTTQRVSSGNATFDEMCGGGLFRDSIILVSGATGTGKTLMVMEFAKAALTAGERVLLFAHEESREQLLRNAAAWGIDFAGAEANGGLRIICRYPESMGLEDHLIHLKRDIKEFAPHRIALDSMSALERVATEKAFREFVIGVTSHIKEKQITGMFTNTTSMLLGGESITETHISTITDSIILLRYVELLGKMRRGITVLKMRGSMHEKNIREYVVDNNGMTIKEPFQGVNGILAGHPVVALNAEVSRFSGLRDRLGRAGE